MTTRSPDVSAPVDGQGARMPLRDHLRELRRRVLLAVAGMVVGAVVGWLVYPQVFDALASPILDLAAQSEREIRLNFGGPAAPLDLKLKVSLFVGTLGTVPWWTYQLWAFVTPGLTRRERRHTIGFVAAAVPLFLVGTALAWVMMPQALAILAGFTPEQAANIIDAPVYLGFIMRLTLAFGFAFLVPVLMVGLTMAGLVRGRTWATGWRWAVLLSFVFAAVATPTGDAVTMTVLAVPICLLYFAAVGLGVMIDRRRDGRRAEEEL